MEYPLSKKHTDGHKDGNLDNLFPVDIPIATQQRIDKTDKAHRIYHHPGTVASQQGDGEGHRQYRTGTGTDRLDQVKGKHQNQVQKNLHSYDASVPANVPKFDNISDTDFHDRRRAHSKSQAVSFLGKRLHILPPMSLPGTREVHKPLIPFRRKRSHVFKEASMKSAKEFQF